jgi:hypothetical protein
MASTGVTSFYTTIDSIEHQRHSTPCSSWHFSYSHS